MKLVSSSTHTMPSVSNENSADTNRSSESNPTIIGQFENSQISRTETERLKGGGSERSKRRARALQEPKQHINESYQDYQKRRAEAGFFDSPQTPPSSAWSIAGEAILGLLFGGPGGIGVGGKPTPARFTPRLSPRALRPSSAPSPRSSFSSETPLIPSNPRTPPQIKSQSLPVKPQLRPGEAGGLSVGERGVRSPESNVLSESASGANYPVDRKPQSLTREAWNLQSKDGLNGDLVRKINDAFEFGQDIRIHTSKNGEKTYLIYDEHDRSYISIESYQTWYPTENYDYEEIHTWRTGKSNQEYAPIDKFDRGRESFIGQRMTDVIRGIKQGVFLDPVKVKSVVAGGETRFEIVDGNHRFHAARVLGLNKIPYEIVS
ncbi:ParB N-terminal domain-containing protein [Burkholderia ubonensis]|uniref:ParB N-terminal domain-containing protein n=1 Tax=Burkholderia ubonensis TaxID=101571 RepID=UPI0009B2FF2A|nr:ParB N-terminal domain-containing protein [Burkholderia ubonensis]